MSSETSKSFITKGLDINIGHSALRNWIYIGTAAVDSTLRSKVAKVYLENGVNGKVHVTQVSSRGLED